MADGWCWFVLREEYCWLVAGGWFVLREKYCWLVADKPSEQTDGCVVDIDTTNRKIIVFICILRWLMCLEMQYLSTFFFFPLYPDDFRLSSF
jgi:hypothetical protein